MDIKSIEQRIREQARKDLKKKLDDAKAGFLASIEGCWGGNKAIIKLSKDGEVTVNDLDVINKITGCAFERMSPAVEEKAVAEFMNKVDGLQDQIDELHSPIEQ